MAQLSRDAARDDRASFAARAEQYGRDLAFVHALWDKGANSGDDWFRAVDLLAVAQQSESFRKVLEDVCGAPLNKITIGRYLGSRVRRDIEGMRILRHRAHGGEVRYVLDTKWWRKPPHPMDWRPLWRPVTWVERELKKLDKPPPY